MASVPLEDSAVAAVTKKVSVQSHPLPSINYAAAHTQKFCPGEKKKGSKLRLVQIAGLPITVPDKNKKGERRKNLIERQGKIFLIC